MMSEIDHLGSHEPYLPQVALKPVPVKAEPQEPPAALADSFELLTEETKKRVAEITAELNKSLKDTSLSFEHIDSLKRFYVRIVNKETGEVIREVPSREILEMGIELKEQVHQAFVDHGIIVDSLA